MLIFFFSEVDHPAEGTVEVLKCSHGNGINHLLMEPGVGLCRIEATLHQNRRIIEVYWRIETAVTAVVIDDNHPSPCRPLIESFICHIDGDAIPCGSAEHGIG